MPMMLSFLTAMSCWKKKKTKRTKLKRAVLDLLVRLLQSMVKKISKRAKKASRSVLPPAGVAQSCSLLLIPFGGAETELTWYSTDLLEFWCYIYVSFAVDGCLLLASLSIVKAVLEVVCTLGGTVFVSILLLRVIWATVSYFQTSGNNFNQGASSYSKVHPVT